MIPGVRDLVIATYNVGGGGSSVNALGVQIRDMYTNALVSDFTVATALPFYIYQGNGSIATDDELMDPSDPVWFGTGPGEGEIIRVEPGPQTGYQIPENDVIGPGPIDHGGVANVTTYPRRVAWYPTLATTGPKDVAYILDGSDGSLILESPNAPYPITAGCAAGLAGAINLVSLIVAYHGDVYYWDLTYNLWEFYFTVLGGTGDIRAVEYGIHTAVIAPYYGFGGDMVLTSGGNGFWADTDPPLLTAGALASNTTGPAVGAAGSKTYCTGSDGTNLWLYWIDNVHTTQGHVCMLPSAYGLPDSLCLSLDGLTAYCLCSGSRMGYPVDITSGTVGAAVDWEQVSPIGATLWPIPAVGAPWVLSHVQVAPASTPWLVGAAP